MKDEFVKSLSAALENGTFVRVTLGDRRDGNADDAQKIIARRVTIKGRDNLSLTYRHKTKDIVKNYPLAEGVEKIRTALEAHFNASHLFTTEEDVMFSRDKKGREKTARGAPSHKNIPPSSHDRQKSHAVQPDAPYLCALGLADERGNVHKNAADKYRQINRYIELLRPALESLHHPRIADMGSGKGYLTFALYDYLIRSGKADASVTGVEMRADLVALCNKTARDCGFEKLSFVKGAIDIFDARGFDAIIALHACDTATDDAIAAGIAAGASLIVVAPCCHKQIRREMEKSSATESLTFLLRHGIFLERQAEMVTDSMRALLLEVMGYKVKIMEFVSDAHTPKNVMIIAEKAKLPETQKARANELFHCAKSEFGIETHALELRLSNLFLA